MKLTKVDLREGVEAAAFDVAYSAHDGQYRRDGVTAYFRHPVDVRNRIVEKYGPFAEEKIAVAYLHDVIEDTEYTAEDLLELGFSEEIVDAVVALTKVEGETYAEFVLRAKENEIARAVKIQDIFANLNDDPTDYQIRKYSKALLVLVDKTK
jgi:(p)ppGpp synthase/HD superfamily hydrolase